MPTWCGNQDCVHACMTISLRPVHILSNLMATYADKEITQQKILRCHLDMYNSTGLYKIWLIASTNNSEMFWVLLAVCFVGSNLGSVDLWPAHSGTSTFLLALYSTGYWFPFKMWRPSHSDHNLLINVSSSVSPAVVITTIRGIEHSGTTLPDSSFCSVCLSFRPVSFSLSLMLPHFVSYSFWPEHVCMNVCVRVCVCDVLAGGDKHQVGGCAQVRPFIFKRESGA